MTGDARARLVVVCGLPGSGKTTVATEVERRLGAVRLNADEWLAAVGIDVYDTAAREQVEALQWQLAERLLALRVSVVVEWGTWARAERDALRDRARALGAAVELRYLDAPLDVLWQRVRDRGQEQRSGSRALTLDELRTYAAMFEPPDDAELATYDGP